MAGIVKVRIGGVWQGMPVIREDGLGGGITVNPPCRGYTATETMSVIILGGVVDASASETVTAVPPRPTDTPTVVLF
jgi:hypothetical protein